MTKTQKKWVEMGKQDILFSSRHPVAVVQEAWSYFLQNIEDNLLTWDELYNNFPFYRKGALAAAKT